MHMVTLFKKQKCRKNPALPKKLHELNQLIFTGVKTLVCLLFKLIKLRFFINFREHVVLGIYVSGFLPRI
jgi:hypothetical protein